jgi:hypothetical protein
MAFCPNCGASIAADAKTCTCGAILSEGGWQPVTDRPPTRPESSAASGFIGFICLVAGVVLAGPSAFFGALCIISYKPGCGFGLGLAIFGILVGGGLIAVALSLIRR